MNKRNNTETGYREMFIEGDHPPMTDALADVMTSEELYRRFLAASPGYFRSNAEALQQLGIDVVRSQAALAGYASELVDRIYAALNLIVRAQRVQPSSDDPSGAQLKAWVIDQIARMLARDRYDYVVEVACDGGKYAWDAGQAP
jgi:hypothetical protein